jgi:DNA uptake protein ComE-like DNA-binding protein
MNGKLVPMWIVATGAATSAASSAASSASATASAGKVSANTASEAEIAEALEAAGVSNAQRWAREVVEYRPYDTSDTNLAKLRRNLAKYNPSDDTVNKIIGALQP